VTDFDEKRLPENGAGRRVYDNRVCHFYNSETKECAEVQGLKKTLKWGIGVAVTVILAVFVAGFGYFAHNEEKTHDLMLEQTRSVTELKGIVTYQVLPYLPERPKRKILYEDDGF
jgi:hypothetical protein